MKTFYSIVFFVAIIVIITAGLKRSNAFFRQNNAAGEVNYLTPKSEDTTAKMNSSGEGATVNENWTEAQKTLQSEK